MTLVVESVLDALNGRHGSEISFVETTKQVFLVALTISTAVMMEIYIC